MAYQMLQQWTDKRMAMNWALIRKNLIEKKPVLKHWLHPNQYEVYDDVIINKQSEVGIYGARKIGKSFQLETVGFEQCLTHPGFKVIHVFQTKTTARDTAFDIWQQMLKAVPPEMRPKILKSEGILVFPNGSTIKLFGADPDSLANNRSGRADLLILDEICFWDANSFEEAYKGIFLPMLSASKFRQVMYATTVATNPKHPSLQMIMPRLMALGMWKVITIFKSPFYSEQFYKETVEQYGGADNPKFRQEYLCELIIDDSLRIINNFADRHIEACQTPTMVYGNHLDHKGGVTVDTADGGEDYDLTGMLSWRFDHDRKVLCITNEWIGRQLDYQDLVNQINKLQDELRYVSKPDLVIDCFTAMGRELKKNHYIDFRYAASYKTKVEDQVVNVNTLFLTNRIVIDPKCVKLIEQLKYGMWKQTAERRVFSRTEEFGHLDLLSCLCYIVRQVDFTGRNVKTELSLHNFDDCEKPEVYSAWR